MKSSGPYPCYSSDTKNYGILGYTFDPEFIVDAKRPTYFIFGDHTRSMRVATKSFSVLDNVKVLIPPTNNVEALLYISAVWHKVIPNLGYARHWKVAKKAKIQLPIVSRTGEIDWQYMEDQIRSIERGQMNSLENYLKATKLDNYSLTVEDKKILNYKPQFVNFKLTAIFDVINTKSIVKSQVEKLPDGHTPYLTASAQNNAVERYISCPSEWLDEGNCVFIGGKSMVVTYQEKDFCSNDSHNLALYLKNKEYRKPLIQLYLVAAITKSLSKKYSWVESISSGKIQSDIVSLPVISQSSKIDFEYMEKYIKVIQELAIKDVVKYKDKVLDNMQ